MEDHSAYSKNTSYSFKYEIFFEQINKFLIFLKKYREKKLNTVF